MRGARLSKIVLMHSHLAIFNNRTTPQCIIAHLCRHYIFQRPTLVCFPMILDEYLLGTYSVFRDEIYKQKYTQFLPCVKKPLGPSFMGIRSTLSSASWGPYSHKAWSLKLLPYTLFQEHPTLGGFTYHIKLLEMFSSVFSVFCRHFLSLNISCRGKRRNPMFTP
jgi:hypothetical protein